ncbi:S-acyltransferase [Trypanosoma theileri]|uniref:Palmitoyltransferase n=1 Tax=Trypanosoma theileri TaxID=67003 RepID=A0A1X0NSC8_9TRYP|nr:S-acyltransferase [Trypanosoma theileri]ORC87089.1 S-acyltransferase [Trypanosoma theileri]
MSAVRIPVIGRVYRVLCPVCSNEVFFDCRSTAVYGIQCHVCQTLIDLRDPSAPLLPNDPGVLTDPRNGENTVCYSPEVLESGVGSNSNGHSSNSNNNYNGSSNTVAVPVGGSAKAQLSAVIASAVEEQKKEMPTTMTGETTQAFSARRMQLFSERMSFLYPIVHVIEYIVFGTKPTATIGCVRIFRKYIPCVGNVNIPVPKTSVSYSFPLFAALVLYVVFTYDTYTLDNAWLWHMHIYVTLLLIFFVVVMVNTVYTDPGFIRPAYLDDQNDYHIGNNKNDYHRNAGKQLTLKDIELRQRESKWETVNGEQVERKWCSTCELYRPPRAAHCYLCGLCVSEHDHHCSVIGVCVGMRNLRKFMLFVLSTVALPFFPAVVLSTAMYSNSEIFSTKQYVFSMILVIVMFAISCSTFFLCLSLITGIMGGATTRERLQGVYDNRRNPYDYGLCRNLFEMLLRRNNPTLFDDDFVRLCAVEVDKKDLHDLKNKGPHPKSEDTVTCV